MANALKEAPLKKEGKKYQLEEEYENKIFEPDRRYMFELAAENSIREIPVIDMTTKREAPHQRFKPYQNFVFTSQITWKGQRVNIRYYDGCDTIFVADQPKDKETIDQFIRQTKRRHFNNGSFGVYGDERQLLLYLLMCSWNVASPFRTRTATAVFRTVDSEVKMAKEYADLDLMLEAAKLAIDATDKKMKIHAAYLGVPTDDYDSGNPLSPKEIRLLYRKEAARDAKAFLDSYGNKAIEIQFYINEALSTGLIRTESNRAIWGTNNSVICDTSGLRSHDAISNRLFEFSQSEEGEEFLIQLKNLN